MGIIYAAWEQKKSSNFIVYRQKPTNNVITFVNENVTGSGSKRYSQNYKGKD